MSSSIHPTDNALSQAERSRLVRSNRKLQALLGETPQVISAALSTAVRSHSASHSDDRRVPAHIPEDMSSFASDPLSSSYSRRRLPPSTLTLATSASGSECDPARPRLLLHLETHTPIAHKHAALSPFSPGLGSPPLTPMTPLSPTTSINTILPLATSTLARSLSAKDTRRRRVAKLARTLGENIAPELVPAAEPPLLRRAASTVGPSLTRARPAPVSAQSAFEEPHSPVSRVKAATLARSFSTSTRSPRVCVAPHRRGESVAVSPACESPSFISFTPTSIAADLVAAKEARDAEMQAMDQAVNRLHSELLSGKRRKEREWSGEWNTEMRTVGKQLRALK
ncbi:hypothetical protein C8R44DRAFT_987161 [Mycena epipterygia]|nr:hypothetical protein C8R44DRAFT_987161 [Mycena epipterygia]